MCVAVSVAKTPASPKRRLALVSSGDPFLAAFKAFRRNISSGVTSFFGDFFKSGKTRLCVFAKDLSWNVCDGDGELILGPGDCDAPAKRDGDGKPPLVGLLYTGDSLRELPLTTAGVNSPSVATSSASELLAYPESG